MTRFKSDVNNLIEVEPSNYNELITRGKVKEPLDVSIPISMVARDSRLKTDLELGD